MAKYNERDPRWIVEERSDGTNVHNWHWTEKDCTEWSREKLELLFHEVKLTTEDDSITVQLTKLASLEGEAFLNNRKNKLIASFDFIVKISWEGRSGDDVVDGYIEVPNFSDEQDEEDWEIRIHHQSLTDSKLSQNCKEQIHKTGRLKIRSLLSDFVKELKSGSSFNEVRETERKVESQEMKLKPDGGGGGGVHRLELIENYNANPQDIYDCFVHPGKLQAFTQSTAKVEAKTGGCFSWFDGSITGKFVSIMAPSYLELDWRFSNWPEGHFSKVVMNFENPEPGLTVLKLIQEGIPESDQFGNANVLEVTQTGWRERIMQRIRMVFGYGV
eukprot:g8664.t1